jgi:hypothetical protein
MATTTVSMERRKRMHGINGSITNGNNQNKYKNKIKTMAAAIKTARTQ